MRALTGESTNVDKEEGTIDGEMLWRTGPIWYIPEALSPWPEGPWWVTGTGMDTEIGKIASLMNATKEKEHLFR